MANQSITSPRFYVDFTQLAKVKGYHYWEDGVSNVNNINNNNYTESLNDVWNFNFYKPQEYQITDTYPPAWFFNFYKNTDINVAWSRLMSNSNWAGIINHNIADLADEQRLVIYLNGQPDSITIGYPQDISNARPITKNGFSIAEFNEPIRDDLFEIGVGFDSGTTGTVKIGAISFGRFYDMPVSPDMNLNKIVEYDGIDIQRTIGGSDYVQIDNYGTPDWLNGEPFVLSDSGVQTARLGRHGRRVWKLSFSFISNDNVFYNTSRLNAFGDLLNTQDTEYNELIAGSEIQQIFDLTLGGALSFIFCPDPTASVPEFAQCRIDQKSLNARQVAHQTWNIAMNIVEVW